MRSQGAGRTWESVSQFGAADFHAISVVGVLVVAALYGQGDILVSRDAGKRFESRVAPMALVDLASTRGTRAIGRRPSSRASTSPERKAGPGANATRRRTSGSPGRRRGSSSGSAPEGPVKGLRRRGRSWQDRG